MLEGIPGICTLRENRQVYMQSLVHQNPDECSDQQPQQFNDLLDQYLQSTLQPPLPTMPGILDYVAYDLSSDDVQTCWMKQSIHRMRRRRHNNFKMIIISS
jgi:hypothetical protein